MNQDGENYVLGSDGQPIRDRYGRPVRRRGTPPQPRNTPFAKGNARAGQRSDGSSRRASRRPRRDASLPPRSTQRLPSEPTRFDLPSAQSSPTDQGGRAHLQAVPDANTSQRPQQYIPPAQQQPPQPAQPAQPAYSAHSAYSGQRHPLDDDLYATPRDYDRMHRKQARAQGKRTSGGMRKLRKLTPGGCFGCLGWPLVIVLVFALVLTLWTDSRLTRVDAMPPQQVAQTSGTNWLLVGSDSRQGLSEKEMNRLGTGGDVGVGRTDTIMLLHIPKKGKAQLVSIPRDSYVPIPGYGQDKINAAFTYGGPELLVQTVEGASGLHIDHYAEVGMGGLAKVVDSVGGVRMCLDEPINDPLAGINLQAGCQRLKGPEALGYVRTRATAQGDLDRVERQREFFAALLDKVTKPGTLANPLKFIPLVNNTASSFIVGENDHVWHLARVALAMGSGVETKTVPLGGFMDTNVGNVVLWDEAASAELWDSMR